MSTYGVKLVRSEEIAAGTMAFHFEKPNGFNFKPGQALDIILVGSPSEGAAAMRHTFSIVSAPFEKHLTIATRMRESAFKCSLKALPIGASLDLEGPFGSLTLHNDRARPAVLIAGGIGITPFISILRQAANDHLAQRLVLIYSNRRPEDAAFLAELQHMEREFDPLHFVPTMTQMGQSVQAWNGETAWVGQEFMRRVVGGITAPIFYLVGPPSMVEGLRTTLDEMQVADDDIRSEEFYGY